MGWLLDLVISVGCDFIKEKLDKEGAAAIKIKNVLSEKGKAQQKKHT